MYQTAEIAKLVGLHPNTIRVYEKWGYISPASRLENGYRVFTDTHLFQLKIIRLAFQCEIVQGNIREKAREIIRASGKEDFQLALSLTERYITHLKQEHSRALEAIKLVEQWLKGDVLDSKQTYTKNEVASMLQLSPETIRNWERNNLLSIPRDTNGYRFYTTKELHHLKIIRTLRTANYSISSILRLFNQIDEISFSTIKETLNTPDKHEEIIALTDRLIDSLEEGINTALELEQLLKGSL